MSKLFKRKGFRLASVAYFLSLGTLAVALFAWFSTSSTFSWFASNKNVDATGMAIKVKTDENASITMDYYRYVLDGDYQLKKNEGGLSMVRYDRVFQEDNEKTPILLKLTLSGGTYTEGETIPLKIAHDTNCDNKIKTATTNSGGTSSESIAETAADYAHGLSSYISSVISIKAVVDNLTWDENNLETSFKAMRAIFEATTDPTYETKCFVTALKGGKKGATTTGDATEKNGTIAFTGLEYQESAVTSKTCSVFVWIDYETTTDYYEDNGGGLINAYIDQMQAKAMSDGTSTGVNMSYTLYSDLTELSIIKGS